jgi:hypothetical protein
MEVRNDLVCHGPHTYTYSVETRLRGRTKRKPQPGRLGLKDRRRGVGGAGYTFHPVLFRSMAAWPLAARHSTAEGHHAP